MALSKPVKALGDWESGDFLDFLMDDGKGSGLSLCTDTASRDESRVNPTKRGVAGGSNAELTKGKGSSTNTT